MWKSIALLLYLCYLVSSESEVNSTRPRIYFLHIKSEIRYRFATTSVTSKVVNPGTESKEAVFDVTLPNEAFITEFTLFINNTEYHGEVKEKEEAKKEYQNAKQMGQSAGIITAKPRETNKFQIQVNVAAAEKVTFDLRYQEILRRVKGVYNHAIYVNPGEIVDDFKIEVAIEDSKDITTLRVPPLRNDSLNNVDTKATNSLANIMRSSPKSAYVSYAPSAADQDALSHQGISGQFVVEYDVDRKLDAGELLVVNGYFVHFFAPAGIDPLPMDIVFVLDKSGSMSGTKIRQLKAAMMDILSDMRPQDRFTIMAFDHGLAYWKRELMFAKKDNIQNARSYVQGMSADGGTNINDALLEGIKLLSTQSDAERAPVLVFLTDGQATSGTTNNEQILSNVRKANEMDMPIFSLAFGNGADYTFVKKVAAQNNGMGRRIYEDSDSSLQISGFYDEVSTVLLKNVSFRYLGQINETTITRPICGFFYGGSEIIVSGSMLKESDNAISPVVTGVGNKGKNIRLVLPKEGTVLADDLKFNLTQDKDFTKITEKMWAYLTIKELLKKKDAVTEDEDETDLNKEILALSLKYKFVTPLTAMVVTLPKDIQAQQIEDNSDEGIPEFHMSNPQIMPLRSFVGVNGRMGYAGLKPQGLVSNFGQPQGLVSHLLPPQNPGYGRYSSGGFLRGPYVPPPTQKPKPVITLTTQKPKLAKNVNKQQRKPTILVQIPGLDIPMCMDLPLGYGKRYQLLEDKSTGNGLTTTTSRKQIKRRRKSRYPLLSEVSYTNSSDVATETVSINDVTAGNDVAMNISFGDLEVVVERQDTGKNEYLQVQGTYASRSRNDFGGILGFFSNFSGRVIKRRSSGSNSLAKLKVRSGKKLVKIWSSLLQDPTPVTDSCWKLSKKSVQKLGIQLAKYES